MACCARPYADEAPPVQHPLQECVCTQAVSDAKLGCNDICRRRFSATFKATCLSFGQSFTAAVIQPTLTASAAVPEQDALNAQAEHLAQVSTHLALMGSEYNRPGCQHLTSSAWQVVSLAAFAAC